MRPRTGGAGMKPVLMISLLVLLTAAEARAQQGGRYEETIRKTAAMVSDPVARRLAQSKGLSVLNVTWEDTGRYKGSSVGPNISDMTIQVQRPTQQGYELTCMPVIRGMVMSSRMQARAWSTTSSRKRSAQS